MMRFTPADREASTERLQSILPPGSTVRVREVYRRRTDNGVTWTRFKVATPSGTDISEYVAAVTGHDFHLADRSVRGQFGGQGPDTQLLAELAIVLHGNANALDVIR